MHKVWLHFSWKTRLGIVSDAVLEIEAMMGLWGRFFQMWRMCIVLPDGMWHVILLLRSNICFGKTYFIKKRSDNIIKKRQQSKLQIPVSITDSETYKGWEFVQTRYFLGPDASLPGAVVMLVLNSPDSPPRPTPFRRSCARTTTLGPAGTGEARWDYAGRSISVCAWFR